MTRGQIIERFKTPSQVKMDELYTENKILERKIKKNHQVISNLIKPVEDEGNIIADKLDKEFPNWRLVLVQELQKIK